MHRKPKIFLVVAIIATCPIFAVAESMPNYEAISLYPNVLTGDMYDFQLLKQAARKGDPYAEYELGNCYENPYKSFKWTLKAAKQGVARAEGSLAQDYLGGIGVLKNYAKAIAWARKGVAGKSSSAASCLCTAYSLGEGVPQSNSRSNYWGLKMNKWGLAETKINTADANIENSKPVNLELNVFLKIPRRDDHREAEYLAKEAYVCQPASLSNGKPNLGLQRLRVGAMSGVKSAEDWLGAYYESVKPKSEKDYTREIYWWKKAAAQGDARAKKYLKTYDHSQEEQQGESNVSSQSFMEAQDLSIAANKGNSNKLMLLQQLATNGKSADQFWLGVYEAAHGNYSDANGWYLKAANQGLAEAEDNLGLDYKDGKGISESYSKGIYWCRKAALQGLDVAEYDLGVDYFYGYGAIKNHARANIWFRKAAIQGFAKAEFALGSDYYYGIGMGAYGPKALYWFKKAAAQGNIQARNYAHHMEYGTALE